MRVRFRLLGVVAVAALASFGLVACGGKAGAAAVVNGSRISESSVDSYITKEPPSDVANGASRRSFVVRYLILDKILTNALSGHGGVPSQSELDTKHDEALSNLFQSQVSGAQADNALRTQAGKLGLTPKFDALITRTAELQTELVDRVNSQAVSREQAVAALSVPVTVSPRYGTWDKQNLALGQPQPPAFANIPQFNDLIRPSASPTNANS